MEKGDKMGMNKKILAAFLLTLSIAISLSAQVLPIYAKKLSHRDIEVIVAEEINVNNMIQYVIDLCTGTMGPVGERRWNPRTQGTPYGESSNAYIYNKFVEWGLDEVEVFENPTVRNWYYLKTWEVSADGYSFKATWPCTWSPSGEFEGELVYVGMGTRPEDYTGKNVTGKIVLADGSARSVYRQALQKGAKGILTDYPNIEGAYTEWAYCSSLSYGSKIPAVSISYVDGKNLKNLFNAGNNITVRISIDSEVLSGTSKSVIGTIKGKTNSDRYVLVIAHADSDSGGPGADDNASGVAAIMEIARVLMKLIKEGRIPRPNFSIKFMAVGTEISDSQAYIEAHRNELNKIIAVLNYDEVGYGGWADILYVEGNDIPFLQPVINKLNDVGTDYLGTYWENFITNPFLGGSDHEPYIDAGVPATIIWTDAWNTPEYIEQPNKWGGGEILLDACPYYHSSGDTPENTVLKEPWNIEWAARFGAISVLRLAIFWSKG